MEYLRNMLGGWIVIFLLIMITYNMLKSIYYQVSFLNVIIEFRCLKLWRKFIVHCILKIYIIRFISAWQNQLKMFQLFVLSCSFWLRSPTHLKVDQWSDENARNFCREREREKERERERERERRQSVIYFR